MGCGFLVQGQQGVIEDWVYVPVFGRTNLLLVVEVETTLKGLCHRGANLAFGCMV